MPELNADAQKEQAALEQAIKLSDLVNLAKGDIALINQAIALFEKKDYFGMVKFAIENKGTIEQQVKEIEPLVGLIKDGWKTSEFWLITAYFAFNVYCVIKGITLPSTDDITLGGLVAAYTGGRHLIKNTQAK